MGIDLGASTIHAVVVTGAPGARATVAAAQTYAATDVDAVVALAAPAGAVVDSVAIDAPAELSTAPHREDVTISNKFRTARCGEIALGQQAKIWVPWVTPYAGQPLPGWMSVGFGVWEAFRGAGMEPLEVYPAGVFRALAGRRVPSKSTRAGLVARIALLEHHVELPHGIQMWSHDGIDALAAAVTARQQSEGMALRIDHDGPECDGSAIWLPRPAR
jgi:predicted nuclease with RNAse H fold